MKLIGKLSYWITVVLILFLPTQLGLHFWPDFAIVNGRRVDYFAPTVYFTDLLIVFLVILSLVQNLRITMPGSRIALRLSGMTEKYDLLRRLRLHITTQKNLVLLVLLELFVSLNVYFSLSPLVSLYKWLKIVEFTSLFLVLLRAQFPHKYLIFPVLFESLLTIFQFWSQSSLNGLFYWFGERSFSVITPGIATVQVLGSQFLRPYGTFSHPNVLGGFLAVALPILISNNIGKIKSKFYKRLYLVTILLGLAALLLTFSRISIVFGLFFSFLVLAKQIIFPKYKLILTSVCLGIIILLLPFLSNLGTENESYSVRSQLNAIAVKEFVKSPVLGTGLETSPLYTLVKDHRLQTTNYSIVGQPIHNIYLLLLSETGLVGLLIFSLIIYNFVFFPRSRKFFYAITTILFLGIFDHYPFTSQQGLLLLVFSLRLASTKTLL